MLFNFDKCKCLHPQHGNSNLTYKMGKADITRKEKDPRLSTYLKVSEQCGIAELKVNSFLGLIRRNVVHGEEIITSVDKSIVRLHVEYCIQSW